MARPTKANEEIKNQVLEHLKKGLSVEDTAELCHIAKKTIYNWQATDSEFLHAINMLKQSTIQDELKRIFTAKDLAKLMKKKAQGFKYTEVTKIYDAEDRIQQTKKVEKTVPPDAEMIKQVKEILEGSTSGEGNNLTINLIRKEVQKLESRN